MPRDERLSAARVASHLVVMVAVAAIMGVVAAGLAIPFVGVLGVGARQVAQTMDNLPAELQTDPLPQKTKLLDSDGETIATFYDENRVNVSLRPDLADHGQGDHRDRGLPLTTSTAPSTSRARSAR